MQKYANLKIRFEFEFAIKGNIRVILNGPLCKKGKWLITTVFCKPLIDHQVRENSMCLSIN